MTGEPRVFTRATPYACAVYGISCVRPTQVEVLTNWINTWSSRFRHFATLGLSYIVFSGICVSQKYGQFCLQSFPNI